MLKMGLLQLFLLYFDLAIVLGQKYILVCYYTNWSQYRTNSGRFTPENIDPSVCTHIVYAFAKVNSTTYTLELTEWNDISSIEKLQNLKNVNGDLKTLLGVGGWNHEKDESPFSLMAATTSGRKKFIESAMALLRRLDFDGLDLDWEYPGRRQHSHPEDKQRFTALCRDLHEAFVNESYIKKQSRLLLTSSVSSSNIDISYEVEEIAEYLSFVSILSYDLYGNWNNRAGHHTTMDSQSSFNVPSIVENWIATGMPSRKVVLGIATYGQTFTLADQGRNHIGDDTTGPGGPGKFTRLEGILSYYEICNMTWIETVRDSSVEAPYSYQGELWVSYDDEKSISVKVETLVIQKNLLGVMVWSIDLDDFTGEFCNRGKFPLIKAAKNVLQASTSSTDAPLTEQPSTTYSMTSSSDQTTTSQASVRSSTTAATTTTPTISTATTTTAATTTAATTAISSSTTTTPISTTITTTTTTTTQTTTSNPSLSPVNDSFENNSFYDVGDVTMLSLFVFITSLIIYSPI